jgi:isoquinoline 1-oxidoreductase beta subunit
MSDQISRCSFIAASATAAAGLLLRAQVGFAQTPAPSPNPSPTPPPPPVDLYLEVRPDNAILLRSINAEMGQGTLTVLAQMLAEELDVPLAAVRVERADWDPRFPRMLTEGSFGTTRFWKRMRLVGAAARAMLLAAAAKRWSVNAAECSTKGGVVTHAASGRSLAYGELAALAATLAVPADPPLKTAGDYRLIGHSVPRVDVREKVDGTAVYGIDVRVPGMLYAALLQAPVFGTRLLFVDESPARAIKGVHAVVRMKTAVAVVADTYWHARKGLDALRPRFSSPATVTDDRSIRKALHDGVARAGQVAPLPADDARVKLRSGNVDAALRSASRRLSATYDVPYLAHATMEPMNCTASFDGKRCEIWAPTQAQSAAHDAAVRLTGLPPERVTLHTTFMGGGFGRRSNVDYVEFAVQVAQAVRRPVKVIWSREEDMRHGHYRPAASVRVECGLGPDGALVAWKQRVASPSVNANYDPASKEVDWAASESVIDRPYAIPNFRMEWSRREFPVPIWTWRSVGSSFNAFVFETMLDEAAAVAGRDPLEYRRTLLAQSPRELAVVDAVADRAGWGQAPRGRHQGIAFTSLRGSSLAHVAEISMRGDALTIHRVTCAIDCGTAVNPRIVEAQVEGGTIFGLTAALRGKITIRDGRAVQGNFDDYPMLRMHETPPIDVHVMPSADDPKGVGETAVAGAAPALVNAIAAATGRRIRRLPLSDEGVSLVPTTVR